MISVEIAASVDEDLSAAVTALIPQLSRSSPPPTREQLARIVGDPATTLFVARDGERIVGMLTLATFLIPTALRAHIEDVVVDETVRGSGAGAALVQAALDRASELGRPYGRPDLAPRPGGGQQALSAHGLRDAGNQRVPLHPRRGRPKPLYGDSGNAVGSRRMSTGNIGVKRPSPHGSSGSLAMAWLSTPTIKADTR